MGQRVFIKFTDRGGMKGMIEAHPFCQVRRAVIPGHPTDAFVVELPRFDAKAYPSIIRATEGVLVASVGDFESLIMLLSEMGQALCFDEVPKAGVMLGPDGFPLGVEITGVEVQGGKGEVVRMLPKGVTQEEYDAATKGEQKQIERCGGCKAAARGDTAPYICCCHVERDPTPNAG